jgi:hypothetical protein
MRFLFLLLLLLADAAHASNASHDKAVAAWNACEDAVYASDDVRRVEFEGGKVGVVDFVVDKCGARPLMRPGPGRLALDDEACKLLFDWNKSRVCVTEDTVGLDLLARTMDPRVFDRHKFAERCQRYLEAGRADSYRAFRQEICEVREKKPKRKAPQ